MMSCLVNFNRLCFTIMRIVTTKHFRYSRSVMIIWVLSTEDFRYRLSVMGMWVVTTEKDILHSEWRGCDFLFFFFLILSDAFDIDFQADFGTLAMTVDYLFYLITI
jgi:hypothetical protein